jgi:hypothetical protein
MKYCATLILVCVVAASSLDAQMRKSDRPAKYPFERIETFKKVRLLEALKLDEATSVKFMARYNAHIETMHNCEHSKNELVDKLDQQIVSNATDVEYNQTIGALKELDKKFSDVRSGLLGELRDILTTKQIAQFIVFERNFNRDLRDIVRDMQKTRAHEK